MPPKIANTIAWQQAELLMQPAFIRVIDCIRKQLDESKWQGTYQDVLIWSEGTTDEAKTTITQLLHQLETASPEQAAEIKQSLTQLPIPHPGYYLCLQRQGEQQVNVDIWELCYQVCFHNYVSSPDQLASSPVEVDTNLIDETGDVDWQLLDDKADNLVKQVFANLPTA